MTCPTCDFDLMDMPDARDYITHIAHLEADNARLTAERDRLRAAGNKAHDLLMHGRIKAAEAELRETLAQPSDPERAK